MTANSRVKYDLIGEITEKTRMTRRTAAAIFTENQAKQDLATAGEQRNKHIYDYAITESKGEACGTCTSSPRPRGRCPTCSFVR